MHVLKSTYVQNDTTINHQEQVVWGNQWKNIYSMSHNWLNLFLTNQTLLSTSVLVMLKLKSCLVILFHNSHSLPQREFFSINSLVSVRRGYDKNKQYNQGNYGSLVIPCYALGAEPKKERYRLLNVTQAPESPMSPKSWSWKLALPILKSNELQNFYSFILNSKLHLNLDQVWVGLSETAFSLKPCLT